MAIYKHHQAVCFFLVPTSCQERELILPLFVYEITESLHTVGCARCVLSTALSSDGQSPLTVELGVNFLKASLTSSVGKNTCSWGLVLGFSQIHGVMQFRRDLRRSLVQPRIQSRVSLRLDPTM